MAFVSDKDLIALKRVKANEFASLIMGDIGPFLRDGTHNEVYQKLSDMSFELEASIQTKFTRPLDK